MENDKYLYINVLEYRCYCIDIRDMRDRPPNVRDLAKLLDRACYPAYTSLSLALKDLAVVRDLYAG